MGVISRKIFPACVNMCVCCPALRSRSRQPVKRYKKLLADIFPKSPDGSPNDRKIMKLCEYAAKNPFRIPKIAKYLEERCHKELRAGHLKLVNVISEVYNKLLSICKGQMVYFAVNLLNVAVELLDDSKQETVQIIGCQTLTRFIYSQVDATYAFNIENLVKKVCTLAKKSDEESHQKILLRASSLQCLSAMVWFMTKFSHIFSGLDEIVRVTLDNYGPNAHLDGEDDRGEAHRNWVDEVAKCEGWAAGCNNNSSNMIIMPPPEMKDPSLLTREELEKPEVWAQICIQRMVELAQDSSTMRPVLDPMFVYFDSGRYWVPRHRLALKVLSDIAYFLEVPGRQQLLSSLVRHLDHKNVAQDPDIKSQVIQTATALVRQIRSRVLLSDVGFVSDLCRHLRKSLQASAEPSGKEEMNLNILLKNSIKDCLLETAKGVANARSLFDMMTTSLEKLPAVRDVARATTGSLVILANMISLASISSKSQQLFPEGLLLQLLKVMLHPDVEVRISGHQIFSVLLIPNSSLLRHETSTPTAKGQPSSTSVSESVTALLEKLRSEKDESRVEKHRVSYQDDVTGDKGRKQAWASSVCLSEAEQSIMKLSEDQIIQLLSALWIHANLPDNLPSNIEAISHSFCLTLVSLRSGDRNDNLLVRVFQLPLSLWRKSMDPSDGIFVPAYQRSLLVLSTAMLMFAAKMFQISDICDLLRPLLECDVDPYLGIGEDYQVFVKPHAVFKDYGSGNDNQVASSLLSELQGELSKIYNIKMTILVQRLSGITKLEVDELSTELSENFSPDETFMFGPLSMHYSDHIQTGNSRDSQSLETEFPVNSFVEDDAISESPVADLSRFVPKIHTTSSTSDIISIKQLLESALEAASRVAGTSVSTSPLPFSTMAGQCEALGTDARSKLSSWLSHDTSRRAASMESSDDQLSALQKKAVKDDTVNGTVLQTDPWLALRLPPASPFDNFLKAARR